MMGSWRNDFWNGRFWLAIDIKFGEVARVGILLNKVKRWPVEEQSMAE